MWFTKLAVTTLCLSIPAHATALTIKDHSAEYIVKRGGGGGAGDFKALGCPATTKTHASTQEQLHAVTSYYDLLLSGNITRALTKWTAKKFIQHAPNVSGDGQAAAEKAVSGELANSTAQIQNIFVGKNSSGIDFAHIYFKGIINKQAIVAVMESWRFSGDCLVEHWVVVQQASGQNFTNPKAFF